MNRWLAILALLFAMLINDDKTHAAIFFVGICILVGTDRPQPKESK